MVLGNKHGTCKLCLALADLCESHVVPEFCYSYEELGHSRHALEVLVPAKSGRVKERKIQKGYREYLFCSDCEQRLCQYERIFAPFWEDNILQQSPFRIGQHVTVPNTPYHAVKLFLLSVFWRASLSGLFGRTIQLGPYSEKLRDILLNDRPVSQHQYPILGRLVLDNTGMPFHGCITQPVARRLEQSQGYSMCFGGCQWMILMSDHWVPRRLESMKQGLCENGDFHLITAHFSQIGFLRQMSQRMKREA